MMGSPAIGLEANSGMWKPHVIVVGDRPAGVAVWHEKRFRFCAMDPCAEELDSSVWRSVAEMQDAVDHLVKTGRLRSVR